jgi:FMN reductase
LAVRTLGSTMTLILGVSASMRGGASHTLVLVRHALDAARECGASTDLLDLSAAGLPLYDAGADYTGHAGVGRIRELAARADGFIVGSPEYHGCMSGAAKNFFDFLYREIAGKLFGIVVATGGSQGVSCSANIRDAVLYCHGWCLPYNVAASSQDFDENGEVSSPRVLDRLRRCGRDVAVYGPLLRERFLKDLAEGPAGRPGFAHWMA